MAPSWRLSHSGLARQLCDFCISLQSPDPMQAHLRPSGVSKQSNVAQAIEQASNNAATTPNMRRADRISPPMSRGGILPYTCGLDMRIRGRCCGRRRERPAAPRRDWSQVSTERREGVAITRLPASLDRRILDSIEGSTWLRNYRSTDPRRTSRSEPRASSALACKQGSF